MRENFVPRRYSAELKELGLKTHCVATYFTDDVKEFKLLNMFTNSNAYTGNISAPLWEQAFAFLREEFQMVGSIDGSIQGDEAIYFWSITRDGVTSISITFETWEDARLSCLIQLIELAKVKRNEQIQRLL
jgi:hypothetical protein